MARWKLTEPHYLNVPDTTWEQKETDRFTGKQVVKKYPVPMHLDPKVSDDWNYGVRRGEITLASDPDHGDGIIVCHEGKGRPRDIIFVGSPTPGMIPLDDEAKAISAKFDWKHPIDDMSPTFSELKLTDLQDELAKAYSQPSKQNDELATALKAVVDMQAQMAAMMLKMAEPMARRV